jgi:hypothetical protein
VACHTDLTFDGGMEFFSLWAVLAADVFPVVISVVNDVAPNAVLTLDVWIYMADVLKFARWAREALQWQCVV